MEDIYAFLYDSYAAPELEEMASDQEEIIRAYVQRLSIPRSERLRLRDLVSHISLQWGTEAFALGLWFGLRLTDPAGRPFDREWLTRLLQSDPPVT